MTSPTFPTQSGPLVLPGPAGDLEAAIDLPDADVAALPLLVVVCHPLPTEGGTMHNKVVTMVARTLRELGAAAVRFNFRGTGASGGTYDNGTGETDDLAAVVEWVRRERPGHALWLAGFSFGAYVSLRASDALQPDALISVAPPAGRWDFESIVLPTCPWLVIQGEADEIVDPQAVYDWLEDSEAQAELVRMPETSHFFHRRMIDLRGVVRHWAEPHLPQAAG
ncbi:Alpha/beta hydrolase [Luteimonas sp. 9C]|uniref:alpha/beta hydrolase n=1 Tax=Luteimonas sp. 9C TaxID=2653148 RepID=UPI0012F0DA24|nr:alpha/beta fold hydrolase [Luteimonas sp. 9C]VXC18034.1 Alpha/beta hydrolase [Luteimonas sp. 9C]